MEIGKRILFNTATGKILNGCFDERVDSGLTQEMIDEMRPIDISFIDLPYGYNENNFKEASVFHIDVSKPNTDPIKDRIIITEYFEHIPSYEELQQQLLQAQGVI